jgi:SAM-dependent methyltransferase
MITHTIHSDSDSENDAHPIGPAEDGTPLSGRLIKNLKAALRSTIGDRAYVAIARVVLFRSETSRYRRVLERFCIGCGLDVGFGGDPITRSAITMDLPTPYTATGRRPVQLPGDCRNLFWFRDDVLDYVYSSHVLEDFPEPETASILREWVRLLRPGGKLVLLLPDQERYLAYCRRTGQISPDGIVGNAHHAIPTFSMSYVDRKIAELGNLKKVASYESLGPYSFAVVYEKKGK